jgi:hypothetical protein
VLRIATSRRGPIALVTAVLMLGALTAPVAASDHDLVLPAGIACADFGLGIDVGARSGREVYREFYDRDGNFIRYMQGGTGTALTFTNLSTGATMSTRSNGAPASVRIGPDGTQMITAYGHQMLIWYPTDSPAGPWSRIYTGRTVFTIDPTGTGTLLSASGTYMDICAALS